MAVEITIQNIIPATVQVNRREVSVTLSGGDSSVVEAVVSHPVVQANIPPAVEAVVVLDKQGPIGPIGNDGPQGIRGPAGPDTIEYVDSLPDFTLIFENRLI